MPSWLPEEFGPHAPQEVKRNFWEASMGPDARESQEVLEWRSEPDADERILEINPAGRVDRMVDHVLSGENVEESDCFSENNNVGYAYLVENGSAIHILPGDEVPVPGGADKTYLLQVRDIPDSDVPSQFDSAGDEWVVMRDNYWDRVLDYSDDAEVDAALDTAVSEFESGEAYNRIFGYTERSGLLERLAARF